MNTSKFLELIFDQFLSILFIILVLSATTTASSYLLEERFESKATFKVRAHSPFSNAQLGLLGGFGPIDNASNPVDIIEVEEVANSFEFTDRFISKFELEEDLIDKSNNTNNYPKRVDFFKIFHQNLKINVKGDYITFTYAHKNPLNAKEILENWTYELDEFFRVRENDRSLKALEYISNSLSAKTFVSLTETLSSYAEKELNNLVMTQVDSQYVLKTIDSPNLAEYKKYPRRYLWLFISLLIFTFLTISITILWNIKTEKKLNFFSFLR